MTTQVVSPRQVSTGISSAGNPRNITNDDTSRLTPSDKRAVKLDPYAFDELTPRSSPELKMHALKSLHEDPKAQLRLFDRIGPCHITTFAPPKAEYEYPLDFVIQHCCSLVQQRMYMRNAIDWGVKTKYVVDERRGEVYTKAYVNALQTFHDQGTDVLKLYLEKDYPLYIQKQMPQHVLLEHNLREELPRLPGRVATRSIDGATEVVARASEVTNYAFTDAKAGAMELLVNTVRGAMSSAATAFVNKASRWLGPR